MHANDICKIILAVGAIVVATTGMVVSCSRHNNADVPYNRQKLCLDRGYIYEFSLNTNGVQCKVPPKPVLDSGYGK